MSRPGPAGFNLDNAYLTSGKDGKQKPHAFHTAENADRPHVIIKLDKQREVRYVHLVNRRGGYHDRAKGLTVWLSADGKQWQQVWQAEDVKPEWVADLGEPRPCRFIKVGLPGRGTLHLFKVVAFGT
ncbi:MAG: discoidin domain-containing protein [Planctomycetota bacterium]|nr:discoidin domain-containing protein [Planctomycetota bacterium]